MTCDVCAAPALPLDGACVFCHSPLKGRGSPADLVEYLAERIPGADPRRGGLLRRGPLRELTFRPGGVPFRIRLKKGEVRLQPDIEPASWADSLVRALSRQAASDPDLRAAISHAGWDLR